MPEKFKLILIAAFLLLVAFYIIRYIIKKRNESEERFLETNSRALSQLKQINSRYVFKDVTPIVYRHTYDNEKFYDSVSCSDYLTYQLQFSRKEVMETARAAEQNAALNEQYNAECKTCDFGAFGPEPLSDGKRARLCKIERRLFKQKKKKPFCAAAVSVELSRSDLAGRIYDRKGRSFSRQEIESIIAKLNDRYNGFYQNRDIWDTIVRVERARVSNKMRFAIMARDGYRCRCCGKTDRGGTMLEIDHIYPIAKGGKSTMDNLQTLCHECNVRKGMQVDPNAPKPSYNRYSNRR